MVPGSGCGIVIINPVPLTASAGVWDNQLFSSPPHRQFVYPKVFIFLSRLCCTMSMTSMENRQTGYAPRLGLGLPQANSSLFEPAALVYLSRQHRKSDSYDRCDWLEWKSGVYGNVWWSLKYL